MDAQPSADFGLSDASKRAFDALIGELVDRARDVQHSQGRLRGLLGAIEMLTADPSLDAVLRNAGSVPRTGTGSHGTVMIT